MTFNVLPLAKGDQEAASIEEGARRDEPRKPMQANPRPDFLCRVPAHSPYCHFGPETQ
jgi:hypothetical protein